MKKHFKTNLIGFIIAGIIVSGGFVFAAVTFPSNEVSYSNGTSGLKSTDVQGAIDELYETCTAKTGSEIISDLLPSNPDELYKDDKGNIRYYGANPNNYVSFNNELWRIIGVIDGKIKIIRNERINTSVAWSNSNNWETGELHDYLNGDYYNSINSTYRNMISKEVYYLGGTNSSSLTASEFYDIERSNAVYLGNLTSIKQYIGLMYPSDYGYAAGSSCLSIDLSNYNSSCKNSDYLFIGGASEWLQTPNSQYYFYAAMLGFQGFVYMTSETVGTNPSRPVLYLASETQITEGDGSQSNPYQIQ